MDKDIRCESYLWVQGIQTSTEDLTPTQREALAIWLKKEYLNELCRGKYAFTPREQEERIPSPVISCFRPEYHDKTVFPSYGKKTLY